MACHDFEGHLETPDRSLGSLSLTATGEQLDDIQVNLDRMYLESPAPTSMPGSGDYVSGRRIDHLLDESPRRPGHPDPEAFDKLPLLGDDVFDSIESVDWLSAPPAILPNNFDEDDRSFLDTNLLYTRFNLLNFVTRIINEDIYAETKKNIPPSTNSNLSNEAAGSGATFRVNRPPRRSVIGYRRTSDGAEEATLAQNGMFKNGVTAAGNNSAIGSLNEDSEETAASAAEARRQKYLTYRRPPVQRQRDVTLYSQEPSQSVDSSSEGYAVPQTRDGGYVDTTQLHQYNDHNKDGGNSTLNGDRMRKQSFNSSGSNLDESEFIPNEFSPTGPAGGCGQIQGRTSDNAPSPTSEDDKFSLGNAPVPGLRNPYDEASGDDDFTTGSHEIDTRTYTRPKKTRMSLGTPSRQLNTTATNSPAEVRNWKDTATQRLLNTTMDLSPIESRRMALGSSNQLNKTIDISPEQHSHTNHSGRNVLNTTMDMSSDRNVVGDAPSNSANLNETFVSATPDRSRRVTRNLSYVVRRDEESPNNNASPQGHAPGAKSDFNNTFVYEPDGDVGSPAAKGSQNTSMEDLNSRVASQIRSLGCSTISRGKVPDGILRGGPNMEEARLVARTSSTDTYSVAHSSESPNSSGLSSPMDAQSYDDIQTSDSSSVRRSMPNLAVIRSSTTVRSGLAFPQAGSGQLRKNHYISDSKLSHLGSNNDRPRLSIHSSSATNTATLTRGMRTPENLRTRGVDRNTSTPAALNRISSGLPTGGAARVYSAQTLGSATLTRASASSRQTVGGSMGNVRSTGMVPPRYTGASTLAVASGLRQPKAMVGPQSSTERLRNPTAPGIPVPTFRNQSRIPGPGQLRFSRPPSSKLPYRGGTNTTTRPGASQKGTVDDWRDGCY